MNRHEADKYEVEDFVTDQSFINYYFKLDDGDQRFWETWLNDHPGNSAIAAEAEKLLQMLALRLPEDEFLHEAEKIQKQINSSTVSDNAQLSHIDGQPHNTRVRRPGLSTKKKVLFFIPILLVVCFALYLNNNFNKTSSDFSEKVNASAVPVVFTLSDSTVVTLAPKSSLRYQKRFDGDERKVYLQGEAQFQVKRDQKRPFKVYSGEIVATVLGTIFKIKQQPGDSILLVELLTGKLKVETVTDNGIDATQSIILAPEERVLYNRLDKKLSKETWQPSATTAERTGNISFRKDDFASVAGKIQSTFSITVINESVKKQWLFTGEFKNTTAKEIVENICIVKGLDYRVKGDTIFIK